MDNILNQTVGELALSNYAILQLFQEYQIDFYSRGNTPLQEALKQSDIADEMFFLKELQSVEEQSGVKYEVDIERWPLDLLADYIQKTHHKFTDSILVELKTAVDKYLEENKAELDIVKAFKTPLLELAHELGSHMKREEFILFPAVRKMVMARGKLEDPGAKSVRFPVEQMIHEHDAQEEIAAKIRVLLHNYITKDSHSVEFKNIVTMMKTLDMDLGRHLHLENNILFPQAIALEKSKLS